MKETVVIRSGFASETKLKRSCIRLVTALAISSVSRAEPNYILLIAIQPIAPKGWLAAPRKRLATIPATSMLRIGTHSTRITTNAGWHGSLVNVFGPDGRTA